MGLPVAGFGVEPLAGTRAWLAPGGPLSVSQKIKLSGNTVHAHAHLAWMMYVFANIQRKPAMHSFLRSQTRNLLSDADQCQECDDAGVEEVDLGPSC